MADAKISALPAVITPLALTEELPAVQSSQNAIYDRDKLPPSKRQFASSELRRLPDRRV